MCCVAQVCELFLSDVFLTVELSEKKTRGGERRERRGEERFSQRAIEILRGDIFGKR